MNQSNPLDLRLTRHWRVAAFFILLFVVEWHLYFQNIGHYFQADTVFLLYHRAKSVQAFQGFQDCQRGCLDRIRRHDQG